MSRTDIAAERERLDRVLQPHLGVVAARSVVVLELERDAAPPLSGPSQEHLASASGSIFHPKMPSGLTRISAPFAGLSSMGLPLSPHAVVLSMSNGSHSCQRS